MSRQNLNRYYVSLFLLLAFGCMGQTSMSSRSAISTRDSLISPDGYFGVWLGGAVAEKAWSELPAEYTKDQIQPVTAVVSKLVNSAETIVRRQPTNMEEREKMTTIQRENLDQQLNQQYADCLSPIPGTVMQMRCHVEDVIRRKEPQKPFVASPESMPLGSTMRKNAEVAWREYKQQLAEYEEAKYLVVATLDWQTQPYISNEQREAIAEATRRYKDAVSEAQAAKLRQSDLNARLEQAKKRKDEVINSISDASREKRPTHKTYLLTSDAQVLGWNKGDSRVVTGAVQRVGAFTVRNTLWNYRSGSLGAWGPYVRIEFMTKLLDVAGAAEVADTPSGVATDDGAAKPSADEQAKKAEAAYSLGRMYQQAHKGALARKYYNQVIELYPNTEFAELSRNAIKTLDAAGE